MCMPKSRDWIANEPSRVVARALVALVAFAFACADPQGATGEQAPPATQGPPVVGAPPVGQQPPATAGMGAAGGAHQPSAAGASGAPTAGSAAMPPTGPQNAGDAGTAGADAGAADGAAPAEPEPVTCPAQALSSGVTRESIDVGGTSREFSLQIPDGYTGDAALPLVVDLHPLLTTASFQQSNSGYAALANREGFIVAWPDGIDGAWDIGTCCVDADDEAFVRALVSHIRERACVDPKRIYAAGFSMGGGMSHYLGCNVADVFAAVAPAAFDLIEEMPCAPSRPISVLMFRGTRDLIVPYAGGASTPPNGYPTTIHFLGAEGSFARWAELNQCTGSPRDSGGGCQTYDECASGVEVTLCTSTGGGHTTGDAELGWEMFQRQPMP